MFVQSVSRFKVGFLLSDTLTWRIITHDLVTTDVGDTDVQRVKGPFWDLRYGWISQLMYLQ